MNVNYFDYKNVKIIQLGIEILAEVICPYVKIIRWWKHIAICKVYLSILKSPLQKVSYCKNWTINCLLY